MPFDDGKKTVSGSIAHTDDAAAKVPFVSLKCGIAPTLTGYSSVDMVHGRKNLITAPEYTTITATLCLDLGRNITFSSVMFSFLATNTVVNATNAAIVDFREEDGTHHYLTLAMFYNEKNVQFTANAPQNGRYRRASSNITFRYVYVYYMTNTFSYFTSDSVTEWQLEVGTAVTAFEPYTAPTVNTVNLGRTIYGGTADVVNGTGTDMGAIHTITSENVNELSRLDGHRWYIHNRYIHCITPSTDDADSVVCDKLKSQIGGSVYDNRCFINSNGAIRINTTSEYATNSDFLEDFGGSITFAFILDASYYTDFTFTPITPTPETVGKVNNVYCDTGNTELTYYDNAHGFSEVTVNKNGVSQTAYLHKIVYGGQADVVRGTCEPKNLFDVGATPGNYEDPAKIESVENGVVSMTIRGSGSTYTYRKQDLTDKGMVTLSLKSSVSRSRLFVEFRSLDDTKWLDNNDITIAESGWSYNQYYHGWYSETASTSITKTITIPNCLYWRVGIGFASNAAEVGTVQTLSDIMVEKASSASEYTPYFEPFTFPPISMETDEGENTLFANEGTSAITYRKETD